MRFTAEARGCLKCKFLPLLHEGVDALTDAPRTDDFFKIKISWMHRLPHFLTHGGPLRAVRAHESSAKNGRVKNSRQKFYKLLPV